MASSEPWDVSKHYGMTINVKHKSPPVKSIIDEIRDTPWDFAKSAEQNVFRAQNKYWAIPGLGHRLFRDRNQAIEVATMHEMELLAQCQDSPDDDPNWVVDDIMAAINKTIPVTYGDF